MYNWVSLDICKHTWYHHHKQGNKHIHHLQKMYPFKVYFSFSKAYTPLPGNTHKHTAGICFAFLEEGGQGKHFTSPTFGTSSAAVLYLKLRVAGVACF